MGRKNAKGPGAGLMMIMGGGEGGGGAVTTGGPMRGTHGVGVGATRGKAASGGLSRGCGGKEAAAEGVEGLPEGFVCAWAPGGREEFPLPPEAEPDAPPPPILASAAPPEVIPPYPPPDITITGAVPADEAAGGVAVPAA